jgi:hypothetical protein
MDREKYLEIEKLKKQEDEIENECDCPECTLDRYSQLLSEITGGCCGCIREVLEYFMCEIIDHIVIESDCNEEEFIKAEPLTACIEAPPNITFNMQFDNLCTDSVEAVFNKIVNHWYKLDCTF